MPALVNCATYAANGKLNATDGKTRWLQVPHPLIGNQRSHTPKTTSKTTPITNEGKLIPIIETPRAIASSQLLGRIALQTPAVNPIKRASKIAQMPIVIDTGSCEINISLTVQFSCLKLGPRLKIGPLRSPNNHPKPEASHAYSV